MKEVYSNTREKMTKTVSVLGKDYASIRAGRANPGVLDKVLVDYYGVPTPINQMAAISVSEARILVIQPWDKSTLTPIYKAIQASDIGINPQNEGIITKEEFDRVKEIKKMAEDSKVAIRSIRRDAIDKIKKMQKASEITEDELKNGEDELQKITDEFIKEIDAAASTKEKEVMSI